jgi:hypothetical protein
LEIQLSKAVGNPLTDLKPIQAIIWICISIFHGSCGTVALYENNNLNSDSQQFHQYQQNKQ